MIMPVRTRQETASKRAMRFIACALAGLFACMMLAGCSGENDAASEQQSAATETTQQQKTVVSVLCSDQLAGPLSELERLYASEHEDVQFEQDSAGSGKAMAKNLTANEKAETASASSGEDSAGSPDDAPYSLVIGLPDEASESAQKAQQINRDTVSDLVADTLVIAAGANGKVRSVTVNDLLAGEYPLVMAPSSTVLGDLQQEALRRVGGASANGVLLGALSKKGKTRTAKSASGVFAKLSEGKNKAVAIVRSSDVYRYGGVRIVGEIPASAYTAPLYASALTTYAGKAELDAAKSFLEWCTTDADAQRIWSKWGFKLAA